MTNWKSGAVAIVAAAAFTLTACSSTPDDTAPEETTDGVDTEEVTNGDTAVELSGTVSYWHAYSADSAEIATLEDEVIPQFEEMHPGVTVESVPVPYDELHQQLVTAVAGAQLPDLVRADINWVAQLANLGVLEPLSETMPDFDDYASQVFPGTLETNRWQGSYYGLPLDTNTRVMMYDPAFFESAGVDVP